MADRLRRLSFDLKRCPACAGKGKDGRDQVCKHCNGTGEVKAAAEPPATAVEQK
ncbi:MAG TPA: hypothetical protein VLA96_00180 [Terriglobales bacterium]|nr:hypothetical protein [Terriglobales bacterium]